MGRPIHYCEDREDPYFKYIPPTTTSTTTTIDPSIDPSTFINYNKINECVSISGCTFPTYDYYEIIPESQDQCCYFTATPLSFDCSVGAIIYFRECGILSYKYHLIDRPTTFYAPSGSVMVYSGKLKSFDIINCGIPTTTTTACPDVPIPLCPPGHTLVTSVNEFGCISYECVASTTTTTTTTPCPCPREINPSCFHIAYRDESPCAFAPASNPVYNTWSNLPLSKTTYKIYIDVFERYDRVQVYYRDPVTTNFVELYNLDYITQSPLSEAPCCEDFGSSVLIDSFIKPSGVDALVISIFAPYNPTISAIAVGICPLGEEIFIDDCGSPTTTTTTSGPTTTLAPGYYCIDYTTG